MSSANLVPRSGPALSRVLARLLVTAGFACAAWLLGALLTGHASADEIDSGNSGSGQTGTVSAMPAPPDQPAAAPAPQPVPDEPATSPSTPPVSGTPDTSAPTPAEEPSSRKTSKPAVNDQRENQSPARIRTATPKQQNDGGLIGGLVGGLLSTVTDTVSTVTDTVGGLIGSVSDAVVAPITCPTTPRPSPGNGNPGTGDDGILPTLPLFDGGSSGSGGTVTIAVPGARPGHSPFPDLPDSAPAPDSTPAVPPPPPAPPVIGAAAIGPAPTRTAASESFHPGVEYVTAAVSHTVTLAGKVIVKADQDQSGGSGGGQAPVAPSAPSAPTCATGTGHDNGGGHRHPFAITGSAADHTQLELIGTSRDHSADGAGRDAALPTTSPD
ncbi:hypothetical protein [Amycolatopsis minnesotensis]|uniref:Uncharacterized protein n=1 Tax=Amycolatopsis minnesotensis TaxID=337894 RepID=A0ABN2S5B4_9PSEU